MRKMRAKKWSQQQDLNPRPTDYKSVALTHENNQKTPLCRNYAVICIFCAIVAGIGRSNKTEATYGCTEAAIKEQLYSRISL